MQEDLQRFVTLGPQAWREARETLIRVLTDAVEKANADGESQLIGEACWPMVRGCERGPECPGTEGAACRI